MCKLCNFIRYDQVFNEDIFVMKWNTWLAKVNYNSCENDAWMFWPIVEWSDDELMSFHIVLFSQPLSTDHLLMMDVIRTRVRVGSSLSDEMNHSTDHNIPVYYHKKRVPFAISAKILHKLERLIKLFFNNGILKYMFNVYGKWYGLLNNLVLISAFKKQPNFYIQTWYRII